MIKWTVETRKLSELKAYEKNPRRITEKGLSDLIKSLELFGLAEPIVINRDDTIVGGLPSRRGSLAGHYRSSSIPTSRAC